MIIVGGSNSQDLAKRVAKETKSEYSNLTIKNFPDGEDYLKFEINLKNKELVFIQTLFPKANDAIIETVLAIDAAKELGAKKITLVVPYLAYIRQDKRFNEGEIVSSHTIGRLLSSADKVITIDPHLHRYKSLNEIFKTHTQKLSANDLIKDYIKKNFKNCVILGPDEESYQWAKEIADEINADIAIAKKTRYSSTHVKVEIKSDVPIKNKDIIIIDDIISTGKTILETIKIIKKDKPKSIRVIAIHGIFADPKTYQEIKKNTKEIITTNTIKNTHSKIDVSKIIADSLSK
jgi:ribose-phosphate pyrophosphokinase